MVKLDNFFLNFLSLIFFNCQKTYRRNFFNVSYKMLIFYKIFQYMFFPNHVKKISGKFENLEGNKLLMFLQVSEKIVNEK